MNVFPTWPCTYPVVQQKKEVTSKKISKKLSNFNYDKKGPIPFPKEISNIDLDDPYVTISSDPFLKEKFVQSLDSYISKLSLDLQTKGLTFSSQQFNADAFITTIENPEDVIGF